MEKSICDERHKRIDEKLEEHDIKFIDHDKRLLNLEKGQDRLTVISENLCEKIDGLTSSIKWLVGVLFTTFLGFFIYMVQQVVIHK